MRVKQLSIFDVIPELCDNEQITPAAIEAAEIWLESERKRLEQRSRRQHGASPWACEEFNEFLDRATEIFLDRSPEGLGVWMRFDTEISGRMSIEVCHPWSVRDGENVHHVESIGQLLPICREVWHKINGYYPEEVN